MEKILNILANYYIILIIITLILIFALIGYFVNERRKRNKIFKISKESSENIDITNISLGNNVSLNEALNKNKSINNNNQRSI